MFSFFSSKQTFVDAVFEANAIAEILPDGRIVEVNERFIATFGGSASDWNGTSFMSLMPDMLEDKKSRSDFWSSMISSGFGLCQFGITSKAGQDIWVMARFYPVPLKGERARIYIVITDSTVRRAEQLAGEAKLAAIWRSQAVIEFTLDAEVVDANENFLSTLGYRLEEIKGKKHAMFVDPKEVGGIEYADFWKTLRSGKAHMAEFRRIGKGGKEVWIRGSYNPLFDQNGKPRGVIKFATDITEEKRTRMAQFEAQKQINSGIGDAEKAISSMNEQATGAAAAAVEASSNVNAVAAGSTELSSSVTEINNQTLRALEVSNEAVRQAQEASGTVAGLVQQARQISAVVELISSIASQTNLLALNATIEAARAGDAGRGFAVVAGEVKILAAQTAKATSEISAHIQSVQASSEAAHRAIEAISATISEVNGISVSISAAVEEQAAVTNDMSQNMQEAAKGVEVITQSMEEVAQLTREASHGIQQIAEAAKRAA